MNKFNYTILFKFYPLCFSFIFLLLFCSYSALELAPVSYKGRFRPSDVYAKLWLYDFYHNDEIEPQDLKAFHTQSPSALELVWKMELLGHRPYNRAPLFWVKNKDLRTLLKMNSSRTSYANLEQSFYTNPEILNTLVTTHFLKGYLDSANNGRSEKLELNGLAHGLWAEFDGDAIKISARPDRFPWNILTPSTTIHPDARQNIDEILAQKEPISEELKSLLGMMFRFQSSELLKIIPSRNQSGVWLPINAIGPSDYNISSYPDQIFDKIKDSFTKMESVVTEESSDEKLFHEADQLAQDLLRGYSTLEGKVYQKSFERELKYPTLSQLKAEQIYTNFPFVEFSILAYLIALTLFLLIPIFNFNGLKWMGSIFLAIGFILHTLILAFRIYILERPPVSNMYETVVYVPWIAVLLSFVLAYYYKNTLPLIASSVLACVLLTTVELTHLNNSLENVQAVLDSQFWLVIHVLMIVGSYGVLALAGLIGHYYIIHTLYNQKTSPPANFAAKVLLQSLYIGVALLIPGTILGGVWAAESWGRFWDWDPKESWAFISAGIYLLTIHAYRFGYIGNFGLAIGSIIGLISISFTWYGVNYILGTGLHTYGFGSGGEYFYYSYLIAETLFIISALILLQKYGLRKT